MRKFLMIAASSAAIAACSQPADRPDAPPPQQQTACNTVTPDSARLVTLTDEVASTAAASDLRGGAITPGVYDLVSGQKLGGAQGWQGARAVSLEARETEAGAVTFDWASVSAGSQAERWTATFNDTPAPAIEYTCGRSGRADDVGFATAADTLSLRLPDASGAGALLLEFRRRP